MTSRTRQVLLGAVAAAILIRLLALAVPIDPYRSADSVSFVLIAESLNETGRIAYVDPGAPDLELRAFRSLLYPIVLAGSERMGLGANGLLLLQALFGVVLVVCAWIIAREVYSEGCGLVAACVGALYWSSVFYERQVLSEALYTQLVIIGTMLTVLAVRPTDALPERRRRALVAVAAGVFMGLAGATKPAGVITTGIMFGACAVFLLVKHRRPGLRSEGVNILGHLGIVVVVAAIVVVPGVMRNAAVLGEPCFLTSGGMNLWMGNEVGTMSDAWRIMEEEAAERGELAMDRWYYDDVWAHRSEILRKAPSLIVRKTWGLLAPTSREAHDLPHRLILPFVVIGAFFVRPRQWLPWVIIAAVALAHVVLGVVYAPAPRYRTPADPIFWVFAAAAVVMLWQRGRAGKAAVIALPALNLAVLLFQHLR